MDLLHLQRSAGNAAVTDALRRRHIQRFGPPTAAPPKKPKVKGAASPPKGGGSAEPLTFAQMYDAIERLDYTRLRPEDFARLDKSELRTLDSVVTRTIEKCEDAARQQAIDPSYVPPEWPDYIYKNVAKELRTLQQDQIWARRPHATISAIVALGHLRTATVGSNATAQALWHVSGPKIRELLWREELGSVSASIGYDEAFDGAEVLRYGYVDRHVRETIYHRDPGAWGVISDPPVTEGGIPESLIVEAIRTRRMIVPLQISQFLLAHADTSTSTELLEKVAKRVDEIDVSIRSSLQLIYNAQVTGAVPWGRKRHTHESAFWEWLTASGMKAGTVYGIYRSFATG